MQLLKLTESEIETINPISYTVIFDNREYKNNWHIEFSGDQQAIFSDSSRNTIIFENEYDAEMKCRVRWPNLRRIEWVKSNTPPLAASENNTV